MNHPSLVHLFEKQVGLSSQGIAISWQNTTYTYEEINQRANQFARYLIKQGVKQGQLVGLALPVSDTLIISMLGILKTGAAYLPIDPHYPIERQAYIKKATQLSVLVSENTTSADEGIYSINPFHLQDQLATYGTENLAIAINANDLLYVLFTSGSTGQPKGVKVSHGNVSRLFPSNPSWLQFNQNDKWTLFHSCSFGFSVWETWGALLHGAQLVICPPTIRQQPRLFWKLIEEKQVTVVSQTPSAFRQLLSQAPQFSLPLSLRWIVLSGEMVDLQDVKQWIEKYDDQQPQLVNTYALTETAGQVAWQRLSHQALLHASGKIFSELSSDMQVHLLDEHQQAVENGQIGELYIEGDGLAKGYWQQTDLTAQKFVPHPKDNTRLLYKTGDSGRWLNKGQLEILGRLDDQVKIRGFRISLYDIAQALKQHDQVKDATVIIYNQEQHPLLTAYIVEETDHSPALNTQHLRAFLEHSLPNYMLPQVFMFMDTLPLNPNNKIDRKALPLPLLNRQKMAVPYQAASNKTERDLQTMWEKLLQLSPIGIKDHFFEVGGDSITMISMLNQIEQQFGKAIPLSDFFDQPTIHALADLLQSHQEFSLSSIMTSIDALSMKESHLLLKELKDSQNTSVIDPHMQTALQEAEQALTNDQVPIGACIVKDGVVIASAFNQVWGHMDVTAHAEMRVIQEACKKLGTIHLNGCTLYSTCEPCSMCFSASHWAHISKIVFGLPMKDAGQLGFNAATLTTKELKKLLKSNIEIVPNIQREEALKLFQHYYTAMNHSTAEYDTIATDYNHLENQGFKKYFEQPFFFKLLAEVSGKSVLDLGCGAGFYTHQIKSKGADVVMGVDVSGEMIKHAQAMNAKNGHDIRFIQKDITTFGLIDHFDIITAIASLHYAKNSASLYEMFQHIANNLCTGGRLVALVDNMDLTVEEYPLLQKWGMDKRAVLPRQDGSELHITISVEQSQSFSIINYFYHQTTYESALKAAGFRNIQWHAMTMPSNTPEALQKDERLPFIGLEAIKK